MKINRLLASSLLTGVSLLLGLGVPKSFSQGDTPTPGPTVAATADFVTTTPSTPTPTVDFAATATQVAKSPHLTVTSSDGRVTLLIPQDALPADTPLSKIKITPLDPIKSQLTIDDKPPLSVYKMEPDGLHFATEAVIRITVDQPVDGSIPALYTISGEQIEALNPTMVQADPKNSKKVLLTASITHFSDFVTTNGNFAISPPDISDHVIDDPFIVQAKFIRTRSSGTWYVAGSFTSAYPELSFENTVRSYLSITDKSYANTETFTCIAPAKGVTVGYEADLSIEKATSPEAQHSRVEGESNPFNCLFLVTYFTAVFVPSEFSTHYAVIAKDPDGDKLTYRWSKTNACGAFLWSPDSPYAIWQHPDSTLPGACPKEAIHAGLVEVEVSDGHGASTTVTYTGGSGPGSLTEEEINTRPEIK